MPGPVGLLRAPGQRDPRQREQLPAGEDVRPPGGAEREPLVI